MKRTPLIQKNNVIKVPLNQSFFVIDAMKLTTDGEVAFDRDADLLIIGNQNPKNIKIVLHENTALKLQIIGPSVNSEWNINIVLHRSSSLCGAFADFYPFVGHINVKGVLLEEYASIDWHLSSLSSLNDRKTITINFIHKAAHTKAKMANFGILERQGTLIFSGNSHIQKGSFDSHTSQEARILVFDHHSVGRADPILTIDDNRVTANHAATVGKINEEHLFYLSSRGLDETAARRLITYGYLKPVINWFSDVNIKKQLDGYLKERL